MTKKLAPVLAAVLPPLFLEVVSCFTWLTEQHRSQTFGLLPSLIWFLILGIITALLVLLLAGVLPKYGGKALTIGAVIGLVLTLLCMAQAFWGFGLRNPFHNNWLSVSSPGSLCVTCNLICLLRARRNA